MALLSSNNVTILITISQDMDRIVPSLYIMCLSLNSIIIRHTLSKKIYMLL